jgi:hypothetical protein
VLYRLRFIAFLYTEVNRLGASNEVYEILFSKFGEYIFAVYKALLMWLESVNYLIDPSTFGFDTFTGFFKLLGFTVPQGTYLMINTEFGATNIYSFMRGLYSDVGYVLINLFLYFSDIWLPRSRELDLIQVKFSSFSLLYIWCCTLLVVPILLQPL